MGKDRVVVKEITDDEVIIPTVKKDSKPRPAKPVYCKSCQVQMIDETTCPNRGCKEFKESY